MPPVGRRGRVNKRFAENIVKQSLPRRGYEEEQHSRRRYREHEGSPPSRVPHYEENPTWRSREEDSRGRYSRNEPSWPRDPPPNYRGQWGKPKRGRGKNYRGRGVTQADPPLALQGIPHLERSFVSSSDKPLNPSEDISNETKFDSIDSPPHETETLGPAVSPVIRGKQMLAVGMESCSRLLAGLDGNGGDADKYGGAHGKGRGIQRGTRGTRGAIASRNTRRGSQRHFEEDLNNPDHPQNLPLEFSLEPQELQGPPLDLLKKKSHQFQQPPPAVFQQQQQQQQQPQQQKQHQPFQPPPQQQQQFQQPPPHTSQQQEQPSYRHPPPSQQPQHQQFQHPPSHQQQHSAPQFQQPPPQTTQKQQQHQEQQQPNYSLPPPTTATPSKLIENLKDPATLVQETRRYYDELQGKKDDDTVTVAVTATDVAEVTGSYKSAEEQKKDEKKKEKVIAIKKKDKEERIQSAWEILHQYWQFVRDNPYDFNGWTYLLSHIESMDNIEYARSAFEGFLPLYPYCFAYWKKLSEMEKRHNNMDKWLGLQFRGLDSIPLCTELWVLTFKSFKEYVKINQLDKSLIKEMYEEGLASLGHSYNSSSFWDVVIKYETAHDNLCEVMNLYKRLLKIPTKLFNKHWDLFLELIRENHPRNILSVDEHQELRKQTCKELKIKYTPTPLLPPKTLKKTPQPEDRVMSSMKEKLVVTYIKTHEENELQSDKRWKLENKIKRPYFHVKPLDKKQLNNWINYLDFEINEGDPVRVIYLFERCLVACALYEDMWLKYATYMNEHVQKVLDGSFAKEEVSKTKESSSQDEEKGKDNSGDVKNTNENSDKESTVDQINIQTDQKENEQSSIETDKNVGINGDSSKCSNKLENESVEKERIESDEISVQEKENINRSETDLIESSNHKSVEIIVSSSEAEVTCVNQVNADVVATNVVGVDANTTDVSNEFSEDSNNKTVSSPGAETTCINQVITDVIATNVVDVDTNTTNVSNEFSKDSIDKTDNVDSVSVTMSKPCNDQSSEVIANSQSSDCDNVDINNVDEAQNVTIDVNKDTLSKDNSSDEQSVKDSHTNDIEMKDTLSVNSETNMTVRTDSDIKDKIDNDTPPETLYQIKYRVCYGLDVTARVLQNPPLTPEWVMKGVSWEDVRHVYRRAAWIHCPSRPAILMKWAEWEEIQGNLDTARELLASVISRYPTLLKARMQLIEMERRAGNNQRVEEVYAEGFKTLAARRPRSWLAIRYARFLFKILLEADRALSILRKALKKDRGNVHLYHHVFDICYQRQPLDCNGVLASVMLALASKELNTSDKYWFAFKRAEFLREHGNIKSLKNADAELTKYHDLLNKEAQEAAKKAVDSEKTKKDESNESEQNKGLEASDPTVATPEATPEATPVATPAPESNTLTAPQVEAALQAAAATNTFPVPFFAPDGAIQYAPMAGYGYGDAAQGNQAALPTAQEVAGQHGHPDKEAYNKVAPSWELMTELGSYGYGKSDEHRWHQDDGYKRYNDVLSKGYSDDIRDKKVEKINFSYNVRINPGPAPNMAQPPPGLTRLRPPLMGPPHNIRPLMPHPNMGPLRAPPPTSLSRPPPGVAVTSMAPPGTFSPGAAPPLSSQRFGQDYGKRRHPGDFDDMNPYKRVALDDQYRSEYNDNYTDSPGCSAPPSHKADFISRDYQHGQLRDSPVIVTERDNQALGQRGDNIGSLGDQGHRDAPPPPPHDNRDTQRLPDLHNPTDYARIPRELGSDDGNSYMNVPDWLVQEGGELRLSETDVGVSVIRYWPHYMTDNGNMVMFRALRKSLKWHQRRKNIGGEWVNQARLMSWIGPCEYNYCGIRLDKNQTWIPEVVDLLHRLIRYTENQYNSCFLNLFRNGYDSIQWQSEDHTALRDDPPIACLTFGEARMFEMRRKDGRGFLRFPLYPGSLLLMEGATQEDWEHQIPKMPNLTGETISLSFRTMYMIEGVTC